MNNGMSQVKVFSAVGSDNFADKVCLCLSQRSDSTESAAVSYERGKSTITRFSNDNMQVQVDDVRGSFAVIIATQTLPVSETIWELFFCFIRSKTPGLKTCCWCYRTCLTPGRIAKITHGYLVVEYYCRESSPPLLV